MAHSEASNVQHSYIDVFGDRLPSRFPVPQETAEYIQPKTDANASRLSTPVPFRNRVKSVFTNVWMTRISMKLFGSQKELEIEKERLQSIEYLVIHPCSKFR